VQSFAIESALHVLYHAPMVVGKRPVERVLRIYAWLAIVGFFGSIFGTLVLAEKTGEPPWPLLLILAGSVPMVPLFVLRGSAILGKAFAGLVPVRPVRAPRVLLWTLALTLVAGFCFFAWETREKGVARTRVREFVCSLGDDSRVLVDGEHFVGDRATSLLGPLAELDSRPAHHSHAEESFLLVLIDGGKRMELELCRDSKRCQEYWVYLLNEGSHRELNEIGRITTDVLDELVPVRLPKMRRNRPRDPGLGPHPPVRFGARSDIR